MRWRLSQHFRRSGLWPPPLFKTYPALTDSAIADSADSEAEPGSLARSHYPQIPQLHRWAVARHKEGRGQLAPDPGRE